MTRQDELLHGIVKNLEQCMDPMHHEWLLENDVTLDEVYDLCQIMAGAIAFFMAFKKE